ncbi:MAG: SDR family oxidoreductase [Thermoplasmata archaeon]|nr:MAG: SDR family oxidoreductase [Thermoplasmata archaeon]
MKMTNKICLITGATSGIGKETAIALAKMGATVVFTSRDRKRGETAKAEIIKLSGNKNVDVMACDLSSFASIKDFSEKFKKKYKHCHILINNAGVWEKKRGLSKDGVELTFATNHLGPFLLTNLLLDHITASAPARIINVSSGLHASRTMNFEDLEGKKRYNGMKAYGQSKLANILFTKYLADRLKDSGVTVNTLSPGLTYTGLFRNASAFTKWFMRRIAKKPVEGAQTVIFLASSSEVANITGKYLSNKKIKDSSEESNDMEIAKRLWEISENYVRKYLD